MNGGPSGPVGHVGQDGHGVLILLPLICTIDPELVNEFMVVIMEIIITLVMLYSSYSSALLVLLVDELRWS